MDVNLRTTFLQSASEGRIEVLEVAAWTIAVATAVALIVGLLQNARTQRAHYDWDRKKTALSYSVTNKAELRDARTRIQRVFYELEAGRAVDDLRGPSYEVIDSMIESSPDLSSTDVVLLLGHWENLALAIHHGVADEQIAFDMVASTVRRHVEFFRDFIAHRRGEKGRYYDNLILLNERWQTFIDETQRGLVSAADLGQRMRKDRDNAVGVLPFDRLHEVALAYEKADPVVALPPVDTEKDPTRLMVLIDEHQLRPSDSLYGLLRSMLEVRPDVKVDVVSLATPENQENLCSLESKALMAIEVDTEVGFETLSTLSRSRDLKARNIREYSGIVVRLDPPLDHTLLRTLHTTTEVPIVNHPEGMAQLSSKAPLAKRFRHLTGNAMPCDNLEAVDRAIAEHGEVVLKPTEGAGGRGLMRLSATSGFIEEKETEPAIVRGQLGQSLRDGTRWIAMPFSDRVVEGDRRMIVAGGEIVGTIDRVPANGCWMANLSRGGRAVVSEPTDEDRLIAGEVIPALIDNGIVIAGIDTLPSRDGGRWLSEINVANVGLIQQLADELGPEPMARCASAMLAAIFDSAPVGSPGSSSPGVSSPYGD